MSNFLKLGNLSGTLGEVSSGTLDNFGRKKVIISTNSAETSVTIDGITSVIDSGLAKLNFYSPRTYTSSLIETPVSKASCNQRRGRAGRTQPGTCYRLYPRKDYDTRESYTIEEIEKEDNGSTRRYNYLSWTW